MEFNKTMFQIQSPPKSLSKSKSRPFDPLVSLEWKLERSVTHNLFIYSLSTYLITPLTLLRLLLLPLLLFWLVSMGLEVLVALLNFSFNSFCNIPCHKEFTTGRLLTVPRFRFFSEYRAINWLICWKGCSSIVSSCSSLSSPSGSCGCSVWGCRLSNQVNWVKCNDYG